MIDFIRIFYKDKDRFEQHVVDEQNFPDLNAVLNYHTGSIKYPYTTNLGSLALGVSEKTGYVKNSIHQLYNYLTEEAAHNHNDFGYYSICSTIDFISKKIIDANITKLTQLEFGFNLDVDKDPVSILTRNFLTHQYKEGSVIDYQSKGKLKQFVHSNYIIKIYDKSRQYNLGNNILRFEVKFKKAVEYKHLGIYSITDLKKKIVLRKLFIYLINRFDELTIVDNFSIQSIQNKEEYYSLSRYSNPVFWTHEIKNTHSEYKARKRKHFERLLKKNNLLKTKSQLRELLHRKFIYLINN
ncbi:MAG: hypothetical protein QM710_10570 [Flavobacterium sp.]